MDISYIKQYLKEYDGPKLRLMEVCGTHTASIAKNGIKSMLSDSIKLISGPGCPVCVTPTAYVDKLIDLAVNEGCVIATFGDLIRVPGSKMSLSTAKGEGAQVAMVYSPFDVIDLAKKNPGKQYVFAAVGFETTTPVYSMLLDEIIKADIANVRLLTSLKTMPEVIASLMNEGCEVDGFLAPGHVCAITGSEIFEPAAKEYKVPFAVSGFSGEELLIAIYGLVRMIQEKDYSVKNFYTSIVEDKPNTKAYDSVNKFFEKSDAMWRGMGVIQGSGMSLKTDYARYDAGSNDLSSDNPKSNGCRCGEILKGKLESKDCLLFGTACTPSNPQGACMVSTEGSCFYAYNYA